MSASSIKELHIRDNPDWETHARALANAGETFILVGYDQNRHQHVYETIKLEYGLMGAVNPQKESAWFSKASRA